MSRRRRKLVQGPLVLAADTSTLTQSVALTRGCDLLAEMTLALPRGHSRALLTAADTLLARADVAMDEVELFAIGRGPGSFTGLRIGLALFKGLALSFDKPLQAVSSLEAIAGHYAPVVVDALLCPCIDARKGEIYTCLYEPTVDAATGHVSVRALTPELVVTPDALSEALLVAAPAGRPIVFVGTGALEYAASLSTRFGDRARIVHGESGHPRALQIARRALDAQQAGVTEPLATLEPRYLRPSDAELGNPGQAD